MNSIYGTFMIPHQQLTHNKKEACKTILLSDMCANPDGVWDKNPTSVVKNDFQERF